MERNVILAKNAGFCFGVKRAVDEAIKYQKEFGKKIYTLGPLIHNNDVVNYLEDNDIAYEDGLCYIVWFDSGDCKVRGTYTYGSTAEIYTFEDFIPALPFNTTDVLDFLEV